MEKRFLEFCEKQDLFTPHRRVLVALSGGLDSMNLYELLYKNKERLKNPSGTRSCQSWTKTRIGFRRK